MATRACYTFCHLKGELSFESHVYIHHDGHPGGAKSYAHRAMEQSGGFLTAESMIRANHEAELTSHWKNHNDIDYRYRFKDGKVDTYSMRHWNGSKLKNGELVASEDAISFVNGAEFPECQKKMFLVGGIPYNETTARRALFAGNNFQEARISLLHKWVERGYQGSANFHSLTDNIRRLIKQFPVLATDVPTELRSYVLLGLGNIGVQK